MEKLPRFVERALRPGRAFYRFCCPPGSASLAALTMSAPQEIFDLIARFEQHVEAYKAGQYNETQLRRDFLDPFFKALGWDVDNAAGYAEAYRDVLHEDAVKVGGLTKAPDYGFRIGGNRKFFLEAKKPSVCIKDEIAPAYQLRRYAWNAKLAAARTPQERTGLERQIAATDTQIDRLVHDLYGLTEAEIAIVEGRTS
jgi:hypothetical protein